jgi:hypothetical protein
MSIDNVGQGHHEPSEHLAGPCRVGPLLRQEWQRKPIRASAREFHGGDPAFKTRSLMGGTYGFAGVSRDFDALNVWESETGGATVFESINSVVPVFRLLQQEEYCHGRSRPCPGRCRAESRSRGC